MSYILDALRKAERDRRLRRMPTIGSVHASSAPRRRPVWPWVAGGVLLANAAALVAIFGVVASDREPATPPRAAAIAPRPATTPATPGEQGAPTPAAAAEIARDVRVERPALAASAAPERPRDPLPERVDARGAARAEPARLPSTSADASRTLGPATRGPRNTPAVGKSAPERPAADDQLRAAPRVAVARPSVSPPATNGGASHPAPGTSRPGSDLKLDVLVYSDDPSQRGAWINGERYVEGQAVTARLTVESITPDTVVLRGEGQRVLLRQ